MAAKAPEGAVNEELKQQVSLASDLLAEHRWAQAGEALSVIHLNDKIIEDKERELIACIAQNYSRIKGVERELAGLQLQLKLTSGPKKSALELLRKKIELQNDKVVLSRGKYQAARKIAEAAEETLKTEEAVKDRLCQELNLLVQQSAHAQLERLEQLTQRMELLNKGFMPPMDSDLEKPAAERQPAVASAASSGAGEAPPPPADAAATQASETPGPAGEGEAADQEHSSAAEAPKTPRDQAGEKAPSVKSSPGVQSNQRRPELSKADQQKAAAARARHVSLQPKARALQPNAKPTVNPAQPANSPFRGFD